MTSHELKLAPNHYDQSLLASAPDPTRAEKQEGYNVGLLGEGHPNPPTSSTPPSPSAPIPIFTSNREFDPYASSAPPVIPPLKRPWYRTKWGIIGLVVAALVIIGAVIGGAVGGTRSHNNNDKTISGPGGLPQESSGSGSNGQNPSSTSSGSGSSASGDATGGLGVSPAPTTSVAANAAQVSSTLAQVAVNGRRGMQRRRA